MLKTCNLLILQADKNGKTATKLVPLYVYCTVLFFASLHGNGPAAFRVASRLPMVRCSSMGLQRLVNSVAAGAKKCSLPILRLPLIWSSVVTSQTRGSCNINWAPTCKDKKAIFAHFRV